MDKYKRQREYYQRHKTELQKYQREYRKKNKTKVKKSQKKTREKYKEIYNRKRRSNWNIYRNNLIDFLGGKCIKCGYNKNILGLDIDHIKPVKGKRKSRYKLHEEYKNLQILCGTCHNIKSRSF